jgi:hypothetical protein
MNWRFWHHGSLQNRDQDESIENDPIAGSVAPLGYITFSPLPLEEERNDVYTQAGIWPKAQSDRMKWYNNTFWGNRLPDPYVGIGAAGPMYGGVTQKMFWTQSSPEQKFRNQWSLTGGYYPYYMSVQGAAQYLQQQQAAWASSAGHA